MIDAVAPAVKGRSSGRAHPARFVGVSLIGVAASVATAWFVSRSAVLPQPIEAGILRGAYACALFGVGIYTWWRRPDSALGVLIIALGCSWSLASLNGSSNELAFTLGMTAWAVYIVFNAYVYLCFPRSKLESRREASWFLALLVSSAVLWGLSLVLAEHLPTGGPFSDCGPRCPDNAFQIVGTSDRLTSALNVGYQLTTSIALVGIAALVIGKARSPARLRRRALKPLGYAVAGLISSFLLYRIVGTAFAGTKPTLRLVAAVFSFAVPIAMLLGQLRGRFFAAASLARLAVVIPGPSLTPKRVQETLRDALGDPTLTLALAAPGGFEDAEGNPIAVPLRSDQQATTSVMRDGHAVALLIHDPLLDADAALVEGLAANSYMLLENAELVEELRASRGRIVTAVEHERVRLERDLHDGAQQRLLAIQIKLALLRDRVTEKQLADELDEIGEDASAAVDELRGLAHGIYPTVLRERGIADGLKAAVAQLPVPVGLDDRGIGRYDPTLEAAVYFCALEAIQNAVKHAGTQTRVTITLGRREDQIEFIVADNGDGFEPSDPTAGIGLVSMRDRVGAVGGELEVRSSPGHGTSVRGIVPVG